MNAASHRERAERPGVSARRTTGTRRDAETRAAVSLPGDERSGSAPSRSPGTRGTP